MKVYLANGLFTKADRLYNEEICKKLDATGITYYAPQRNASINDKSKPATSKPIYQADTDELLSSDIILVVLDGQDVGVATEVGLVAGYNEKITLDTKNNPNGQVYDQKIIIGIYTDNRDYSKTVSDEKNKSIKTAGIAESQYSYINLYLIGAIKKYGCICDNEDAAIKKILEYQKWAKKADDSIEKNENLAKKLVKETMNPTTEAIKRFGKYTKDELYEYDKKQLMQILIDLGHPMGKRGRGEKDPLRPKAADPISVLIDKILETQNS